MGKMRPTTKERGSERESPGNVTWSLLKLYLKMKWPVDIPNICTYWWSGIRALPNSCIRLLFYFSDTNHECYKISVEAKIAIGWIGQETSKRWIIRRTPKEKEGREEADFRKEGMIPRGRKQSNLALLEQQTCWGNMVMSGDQYGKPLRSRLRNLNLTLYWRSKKLSSRDQIKVNILTRHHLEDNFHCRGLFRIKPLKY